MSKKMTEAEILNRILNKIISHEWQENEKLPSENILAEEFHASRTTVRNAYMMLAEMGYIRSSQGVGHFLRKRNPTLEISIASKMTSSFTEKMVSEKIPYEAVHLYCRSMEARETLPFQSEESTAGYYKIARLRILYDMPAAIHYSYISERDFPNISTDGHSITSSFAYYRSQGHKNLGHPEGAVLSVTFPTIEERELLRCGSLVPLLIRESASFNLDTGQRVEFSKTLYRTDLFKYKIHGS